MVAGCSSSHHSLAGSDVTITMRSDATAAQADTVLAQLDHDPTVQTFTSDLAEAILRTRGVSEFGLPVVNRSPSPPITMHVRLRNAADAPSAFVRYQHVRGVAQVAPERP